RFGEGMHERVALVAGGNEHEYGLLVGILAPLDIRREVGILQWHAGGPGDLPARCRERPLEFGLGVDARTVIRNERVDLPDAVLRRPGRHRPGDLREREREATN